MFGWPRVSDVVVEWCNNRNFRKWVGELQFKFFSSLSRRVTDGIKFRPIFTMNCIHWYKLEERAFRLVCLSEHYVIRTIVYHIHAIKSHNTFDVLHLTGCSPVMCMMFCDYGFVKDPVTRCPVCRCLDPCQVINAWFLLILSLCHSYIVVVDWHCSRQPVKLKSKYGISQKFRDKRLMSVCSILVWQEIFV